MPHARTHTHTEGSSSWARWWCNHSCCFSPRCQGQDDGFICGVLTAKDHNYRVGNNPLCVSSESHTARCPRCALRHSQYAACPDKPWLRSAATENTAKTGRAETPRLLFGRRQNVEKQRSHSEKCLVRSGQSYLFLKFHKSALHVILKKQTTKSQKSLNRFWYFLLLLLLTTDTDKKTTKTVRSCLSEFLKIHKFKE